MAGTIPYCQGNNHSDLTNRSGGKGKKILKLPCELHDGMELPSAAVFLAETGEWEDQEEEEERVNINTIMPKPHLVELERFKGKYRDMLQDVPGKTSLVFHNIPTGDAPPPPPSEIDPLPSGSQITESPEGGNKNLVKPGNNKNLNKPMGCSYSPSSKKGWLHKNVCRLQKVKHSNR